MPNFEIRNNILKCEYHEEPLYVNLFNLSGFRYHNTLERTMLILNGGEYGIEDKRKELCEALQEYFYEKEVF